MRNLMISSFVLAAAFLLAPLALAEGAETALPVSVDPPAAAQNDAVAAEAELCLADEENLSSAARTAETPADSFGETNAATCWIQNQTIYQCNCNLAFGRSKRQLLQEQTCCTNGWCSGWSTVSSSCTNIPC